jgi:transposase-like protein
MAERRTSAEWAKIVGQWGASGLSAARYAREHDLSIQSLWRWIRIHRNEPTAKPVSFVRLDVIRSPSSVVVEVGGARIRVQGGFDAELLRSVVSALSGGGEQ